MLQWSQQVGLWAFQALQQSHVCAALVTGGAEACCAAA